MEKVIISKQFSLKLRDFAKGLILAVGTPMLYLVQELIPGWEADPFLKVAASAFISYLIKNFFDKSKVVVVTKNNAEAEQYKKDLE